MFSSPVDNLNNQIFTIFKAEPIDACTRIADPEVNEIPGADNNPYLIIIDGDAGYCGFRRRI